MRITDRRSLLLLIAFAAALLSAVCWPAAAAPGGKVENVDFTKGLSLPKGATHDWNLGATGARGWMHSDQLTTIDARQVYITAVATGSPAEGVLAVGDVLLGVEGQRFSYDPRTEIGKAITRAESGQGRGRLVVTRWRDGQTEDVVVQLPVLGTYSATAPYGCPKSKRILEQGCAWLAEQMQDPGYRRNHYDRSLNALALLASGDQQYLPLIKREAELAAGSTPGGLETWWYGPLLIFLSEYVIATGDDTVLPGVERLALKAARGQSNVGSWGHRFSRPNGRLGGYGMMNAPGVVLTTGLVLAREAGVADPDLDLAIQRSTRMLRFYVGKGSIPYGDHSPWILAHDDNGKNGMAAVLFGLLGDAEAAEYFSRMSVACHGGERDCGHTGNFFNIFWSIPGVNLSGPHATGAWMNEFGGWHHDLARTHEGRFVHLGPPQVKHDRYHRWDCTGAYLLHYAMPLKKTRLTGKGPAVVPRLSRDEAARLIEDGRGWNYKDRNRHYDAMTNGQLLERLSSWSPVVRDRAGMALARRKAGVAPQLIEKLAADDLYTRYGACVAIKHLRGAAAGAVPALMQRLEADDLWLRILAAQALQGIGEPAKVAAPVLLERVALEPGDEDPRAMEQRYLLHVLFARRGGLIGQSVEGIDRERLYAAVRAGLTHENGGIRSTISDSVYRQLTLDELRPLLPAIHRAVIEPSPSGVMFASNVRFQGVELLARHRVAEGLDAGVYLLEHRNGWGTAKRLPKLMEAITSYGVHAKRVIPDLQRIADALAAEDAKRREHARQYPQKPILEAIKKIEASTNRPELITIGARQSI